MNEEFFFLIRVVNNNNDYSITNEIYSKNINNSNLGIKDREGLNKLIAKSSYKTNKEIYIKFKSLNKGEMSLIIKNCFSNKVGEFWFEIFILDKYFKELSYLKSKLFKTVEGTIIIQQITQPDNFTLYQGSVWALNFDIKINMPGENDYLVIQHDNHKAMESKVNMIASTCDFTQKDDFNFKQEFGIRPICYPIQKDLNFSSNLGSGIFFKLGEYSNEAIIKLKIFVYAEFCGTTDTVCDIFDDQKCSSVKKFSFTASLYKVVSLNSEQKLQNRIATSVSKKIDQLCTNNYLYNTININDNTAYEPYEYFQKTIYNTHKNSIFYKEYTDFEFGVLKED